MLRQLNLNEMEVVSGGIDENESTIGWSDIWVDNNGNGVYGDGLAFLSNDDSIPGGGHYVGVDYGGTVSEVTATQLNQANNDERCYDPPAGFNSHAEYTNFLNSYSRGGGAAGDGNLGASGAAAALDLRNIYYGCEYDQRSE